MSLKTDIEGDVTSVFLDTEHFAESVTHWPLSVEGNAAAVDAIVFRDEPTRESEKGEQSQERISLFVDDSVTIDRTDVWFVDSVRYETTKVERAEGGGKYAYAVKRKRIRTTADHRVRTGV